jgi:uncharacterized integral membrane protein/GGDEF domain-containing protein
MPLLIVAAIVIAFLAIAFALQNNTVIAINLLVWNYRGSLAIVLLSTLAIGVLIGLLVLIPSLLKRGWRISKAKRQSSALEDELFIRERELDTQVTNAERSRQSHENLLQALNLTDTNTGMLDAKVLPQTLAALIKQMRLQPGNPQFDAISLLILEAQRQQPMADRPGELPNKVEASAQQNAQLDVAIAAIIRRNVTLETWLYCDSRAASGAQFMCVLTGMTKAELRDYGESLREALIVEPLKLRDGSMVAVDAKVGGALCDRAHPTSREQLIIDKAYQALAEASRPSRNPIKGNQPIKIVTVSDA